MKYNYIIRVREPDADPNGRYKWCSVNISSDPDWWTNSFKRGLLDYYFFLKEDAMHFWLVWG